MQVTVEISMYPLKDDYKPAIIAFINSLRERGGIEIVTNQMSTQLSGDFDAVTSAVNEATRLTMEAEPSVVFVQKWLSTGLDIARTPDLSG